KAEKVMCFINKARIPNGMVPVSLLSLFIRLGTNGDSYHEYLLYGRTEPMYEDAIKGIHENLLQTPTSKITYAAGFLPSHDDDWRTSWKIQHKHEHLACFLAGSLMLGTVTTGATPNMRGSSNTQKTVSDGVALLEGCMETHKTSTGLSPEGVSFHDPMNEPGGDWYIEDSNQQWPSYYARYMLRPEIVESLFIVWRLTGDKRYRDYSWAVFSVTEKHCRQKEACFVSSSTPHIPPFIHSFTRQFSQGGYATVMHVDGIPVVPLDKQETFFLSETLYLLTFSEDTLLPLKDIVFNTERLSCLGLPSTCNS
ncbi:glycoside hydrolase, partial [Mycena rebaudengoi]